MYTFMKILSFIICRLPIRCRRALGRGLGYFFWTFVPKGRKILAQASPRLLLRFLALFLITSEDVSLERFLLREWIPAQLR